MLRRVQLGLAGADGVQVEEAEGAGRLWDFRVPDRQHGHRGTTRLRRALHPEAQLQQHPGGAQAPHKTSVQMPHHRVSQPFILPGASEAHQAPPFKQGGRPGPQGRY